ncbi:hypothetical protein AUK40_05615 [Candidatus Wirthbacteria bacterium CG2_30_54_11]|uniref:Glycosyltransferase RgtA/B/C/D-like domain-containing protein n=1 Tax=Candidatus Wirthbacteria bacterium CG2_30_54_11 TaxID=1817892 RepID=A0A1J5IUD8_9BACT|nr:MAG: hypothetical protein AUK40_05615 [Candidatus Wirthbacteria bacterium CG2_30_54_11]
MRSKFPRSFVLYTAVALLTCGLLALVLKIWQADLSVPFLYGADTLWAAMAIKTVIQTGWYLTNPSIGAPFGTQFYDWLSPDNLHYLILKIITLFSSDWAVVLNVFYLLMFPLTAICALFVLRRFRLSTPVASALSILYAFLPYHFIRGEGHLLLAAYYLIPFAVLIASRILDDKILGSGRGIAVFRSPRLLFAVVLCLLMASSGIYYAFFTCFLFLLTAVMALIGGGRDGRRKAGSALLLIAVIVVGVLINILPSIFHSIQQGPNKLVTFRRSEEAETYGLKISQLLLPVTGHRLPLFAEIKDNYNGRFPLVNENDSASLGMFGSLGLLVLLGWSVFGRAKLKLLETGQTLLDRLAAWNLASILLATIGGFAVVVSMTLIRQIRGYNRISVFIAFFALLALGLVIEALLSRIRAQRLQTIALWIVSVVMVLVGVGDQTPREPFWRGVTYEAIKVAYTYDHAYIQDIEATMPSGAMIFQLPYMYFPESGGRRALPDYELFKPYLHSVDLRWSYGGMRGRDADLWNKQESERSVDQLLPDLALAGFLGIYIDRTGYAVDEVSTLESEMAGILQIEPLVSEGGLKAFYPLTAYAQALRYGMSESEWQARQAEVLVIE